MPQVVRENLTGVHSGAGAELFHIMADVCPVQGLSTSGAKNCGPRLCPALLRILIAWYAAPFAENRAVFSFHADFRPPGLGRLHRNMLQLADPDACTANGQHDQV